MECQALARESPLLGGGCAVFYLRCVGLAHHLSADFLASECRFEFIFSPSATQLSSFFLTSSVFLAFFGIFCADKRHFCAQNRHFLSRCPPAGCRPSWRQSLCLNKVN